MTLKDGLRSINELRNNLEAEVLVKEAVTEREEIIKLDHSRSVETVVGYEDVEVSPAIYAPDERKRRYAEEELRRLSAESEYAAIRYFALDSLGEAPSGKQDYISWFDECVTAEDIIDLSVWTNQDRSLLGLLAMGLERATDEDIILGFYNVPGEKFRGLRRAAAEKAGMSEEYFEFYEYINCPRENSEFQGMSILRNECTESQLSILFNRGHDSKVRKKAGELLGYCPIKIEIEEYRRIGGYFGLLNRLDAVIYSPDYDGKEKDLKDIYEYVGKNKQRDISDFKKLGVSLGKDKLEVLLDFGVHWVKDEDDLRFLYENAPKIEQRKVAGERLGKMPIQISYHENPLMYKVAGAAAGLALVYGLMEYLQ